MGAVLVKVISAMLMLILFMCTVLLVPMFLDALSDAVDAWAILKDTWKSTRGK